MRAVPPDQRLRHNPQGGSPWLNETMTDIQLALTGAPNRLRAGPPSRASRLRQGKNGFPSFQTLRLLPRLAALTGSEAISGWCQITDQTRPLSPVLITMRTIGLPRQIVSACVSSAPHVTAATMSESEAQHRLLSPRRMPLLARLGKDETQRETLDSPASRQKPRTGVQKASRRAALALRKALPAPLSGDTIWREGADSDAKYKGSCTYQRRGILERQPPFSGNCLYFSFRPFVFRLDF